MASKETFHSKKPNLIEFHVVVFVVFVVLVVLVVFVLHSVVLFSSSVAENTLQ